jgi:SAM-dependent methyltransferase
VTVIDASRDMLELSRRRTSRLGPTHFTHADIRTARLPAGRFDLIVTHFLLDCFPPHEAAEIASALAMSAKPQARWLVAEFTPATGSRLAGAHAAAWLAAMRVFFGLTTGLAPQPLPDVAGLLRPHGFDRQATQSFRWGLVTSDLWQRGETLARESVPATLGA